MQDTYRERLSAPLGYWIIGLAVGVTFVLAIGFYLGPWLGLAATVVTVLLVAGGLLAYGGVVVEVSAAGLRVGSMRIPWKHVAAVTPHDPAAMRRRLGPDADPAAVLVERPYIRTGVEIGIADPRDPHPYWLVSSRHPEQFAAACRAHLPAGLEQDPHARQDDPEPTEE